MLRTWQLNDTLQILLPGPPSPNVHHSTLSTKRLPRRAFERCSLGIFASETEFFPVNVIVQISFLWTYSTMSTGGRCGCNGLEDKEGKNFCTEEEEQCCRSFIHTSIDSRREIEPKKCGILDIYCSALCKAQREAYYPARSLETNKIVVAKSTGCYWSIKDLDDSRKTEDDIVCHAFVQTKTWEGICS